MQSVRDHYAKHLSPIYSWMSGGVDAALVRGSAELDTLGLTPQTTGVAVDLGAGFGMHSIPLARGGFSVLAVDTDAYVTVHDLLHEREESQWKLRVSCYRKLRLAPDWVSRALENRGFRVTREAGLGGMVRLVACVAP